MKNLLMVSNVEYVVARIFKTTLLLLIGLALGTAFWVASMPVAQAQDMSPTKMIESQLPQGKTTQSAAKADYLAAVCSAVKKWRSAAPQIVRAAIEAHPAWKNDILRTAFQCLGSDDCNLLGRVLRAAISADPKDANAFTEIALELAPTCAGAFGGGGGGGDQGEGNFGNPPGNLNPPPGSIGGGGGQGNVVVVCFHNQTLFVTPERAQELVRQGATVGACAVTGDLNQ